MAIVTYSRAASKDEMAREIDRRGNVIEALEAEVARLRERLGPRGLEPVIIDGVGHYASEPVRAHIAALEAEVKRLWEWREQAQHWERRYFDESAAAMAAEARAKALEAARQTALEEAEHFIQAAIDSAPEPLRRLGEWLSRVLDEDEWKTVEPLLLGCARALTGEKE